MTMLIIRHQVTSTHCNYIQKFAYKNRCKLGLLKPRRRRKVVLFWVVVGKTRPFLQTQLKRSKNQEKFKIHLLTKANGGSIRLKESQSLFCNSPVSHLPHPITNYFCSLGVFNTFFESICCFGKLSFLQIVLNSMDDRFNSITRLINFPDLEKPRDSQTTSKW